MQETWRQNVYSEQTTHFKYKNQIDMLLDIDNKQIKYCSVKKMTKNINKKKLLNDQVIINHLPLNDKGWVPHFCINEYAMTLRIARIPYLWYGKQQQFIFDS